MGVPPQQEFSKDLSRNTGLGSQVLHVTWPCIRFLVDEMGLMLPLLTQTVSVLGFLLHRGMLIGRWGEAWIRASAGRCDSDPLYVQVSQESCVGDILFSPLPLSDKDTKVQRN